MRNYKIGDYIYQTDKYNRTSIYEIIEIYGDNETKWFTILQKFVGFHFKGTLNCNDMFKYNIMDKETAYLLYSSRKDNQILYKSS